MEKFVYKNLLQVHSSQGYKEEDQVMVWTQAYRNMTKLSQSLWIGPFNFSFSIDRDMYFLTSSNGTEIPIPIHIDFIGHYYPSIT